MASWDKNTVYYDKKTKKNVWTKSWSSEQTSRPSLFDFLMPPTNISKRKHNFHFTIKHGEQNNNASLLHSQAA